MEINRSTQYLPFIKTVSFPIFVVHFLQIRPRSWIAPCASTYQMGIVAPNLAALIGDTVGARLISKAGSLTSLAKCPASTVQILGAEKVCSLIASANNSLQKCDGTPAPRKGRTC